MKIKNLKCILGIFGLSTTLTLTGCGIINHVENLEESLESLEESETLKTEFNELVVAPLESSILNTEEATTFDEEILYEAVENVLVEPEEDTKKVILDSQQINDLIDEINRELTSKVEFSSYYYLDNISIFIYSNSKTGESLNLSDDFYSKLNLFLSQDYSYSLSLCGMGVEVDFSKLDLSSINKLYLEDCKEEFHYDDFLEYTYDVVSFVDIPYSYAAKIVDATVNSETEIEYSNYKDGNNDNLNFVRFLVENDICFAKYSGIDINNNEDEIYNLLSCLNAKKVNISKINVDDNQVAPILNLNLKLNDRIEAFYIFDYHYRELGNIEIISDNSDFGLDLRYVKITDNTSFSLPDNSSLEMAGIYTNISAFYDLNNISELSYYDCDKNESVYGYKDIFYETVDEIRELHGNVLVK